MDLDALLTGFFGTDDLAALEPPVLASGLERLATAFAVERDPGRRFALWVLLFTFGRAPDPEVAFDDPAERRAAQDFAWNAAKAAERLA